MSAEILASLVTARAAGRPFGITSVCSAHPLVIEAALVQASEDGGPALIEATCNQVNHHGGYTGMTPAGFRDFVNGIAARLGFPRDLIILGGDHLGPNPWKSLPAGEAMAEAEAMVRAYALAGFAKLHLDTSMGCAGEPVALADTVTAERAARLAAVAETAAAEIGSRPYYVVGTEVPTPGGALEALDHMQVTAPDAPLKTYDIHKHMFMSLGLGDALSRVVALVVQPGVEFGHDSVARYRPEAAAALSASLQGLPGLVFEAHSTDYQSGDALAALVEDGFPILKVGPALTFALREALYGLDAIASCLIEGDGLERLPSVMERLMVDSPGNWQAHYHGTPAEQRLLRHFSYSDRIRYYWAEPDAVAAVDELFARLADRPIPPTLVSQFLSRLSDRVAEGRIAPDARSLAIETVRDVLRPYAAAGTAR
jgi:D-tagatose 6-phosphate 4-epimerase